MTYPTAVRMAEARALMAECAAAGFRSLTIRAVWLARSPLARVPSPTYWEVLARKRARHVAMHRSIAAADRKAIQAIRRCAYCGRRGYVVIDHIMPVSRGGTRFLWNLAPACGLCNASKSDMTLAEWAEHLSGRSDLDR